MQFNKNVIQKTFGRREGSILDLELSVASIRAFPTLIQRQRRERVQPSLSRADAKAEGVGTRKNKIKAP
jgi:hypothetical protein